MGRDFRMGLGVADVVSDTRKRVADVADKSAIYVCVFYNSGSFRSAAKHTRLAADYLISIKRDSPQRHREHGEIECNFLCDSVVNCS